MPCVPTVTYCAEGQHFLTHFRERTHIIHYCFTPNPPTTALVTPEMAEATAESASVTVSWGAVEHTDRYTVTLSQVQGTNQQGLCPTDYHTASLIVEAPSTTVSIVVGEVVDYTATDMLRAFTTYEVTVEAVSDVGGTSLPSETRRVLTPQTN